MVDGLWAARNLAAEDPAGREGAAWTRSLVGLENDRTPSSRLLAVPAPPTRYLQYVREIAEESLDWKN